MKIKTLGIAAAALALVASGCTRHRSEMASSERLEESEVVTALVALHQGEIDVARVAITRSTDANVQGFAGRVATEHEAAIERLHVYSRERGLMPRGSELSQRIAQGTATTAHRLNAAPAESFDALYLSAERDGHMKVVALIDAVILPSIEDPVLRDEVQTQRERTLAHLDHVETVRVQLTATRAFERERAEQGRRARRGDQRAAR